MNEEPFEAMMRKLEATVRDLESGGLDLDASMAKFETGLTLVRALQGRITRAEERLEELTKDGGLRELKFDS